MRFRPAREPSGSIGRLPRSRPSPGFYGDGYQSLGLIETPSERAGGISDDNAKTKATVYLPTSDPAKVLESGRPIAQVQGVTASGAADCTTTYNVLIGDLCLHDSLEKNPLGRNNDRFPLNYLEWIEKETD